MKKNRSISPILVANLHFYFDVDKSKFQKRHIPIATQADGSQKVFGINDIISWYIK